MEFIQGINYLIIFLVVPYFLGPLGFAASLAYSVFHPRRWLLLFIGLISGILGVLFMAENDSYGNPLSALAGFTVGVTLGVGYTSCFLATPRQRVASLIGSLVGLGWGILSVFADTYLLPARNIAITPRIIHNLIYGLIYELVITGLIFVFVARGVDRIRNFRAYEQD